MEIEPLTIISLIIYKSISLIIGGAFAYMGYRLFQAGAWGHAGELEANFDDNKILIKKAAPGTFFVIFGAIIIIYTLLRGLEYEVQGHTERSHVSDPAPALPNKPPL